ncbi:MAG: hypothetical protein ISR87_12060 [Candidatus Marinimicrobia bacterium]|nr:hypothetical protein [Candidatus Neomarinimicrobiota bacterium]
MHEHRRGNTLMKYVISKIIYRLPELRTAQIKQFNGIKLNDLHSDGKASRPSGKLKKAD